MHNHQPRSAHLYNDKSRFVRLYNNQHLYQWQRSRTQKKVPTDGSASDPVHMLEVCFWASFKFLDGGFWGKKIQLSPVDYTIFVHTSIKILAKMILTWRYHYNLYVIWIVSSSLHHLYCMWKLDTFASIDIFYNLFSTINASCPGINVPII